MGKNGGYVQLGIMLNLQVSTYLQHLVHKSQIIEQTKNLGLFLNNLL